MTVAKQIARPTPYATSNDFRQVFDEHMNSLYLLAFLLTADQKKAEQCFVSGLENAVEGSPVFKEWAHSWARRMVILNAVRALSPRPTDGNDPGRSSSDLADRNSKMRSAGQQAEIAAILDLKPFERFAYVITVLERHSDQECSILLGCTRRDALAARVRALEEVGTAMEIRSQQLPSASLNNPALREQISSALHL